MKPYGDVDPNEVYGSFERQVIALIKAGVDLISIETMTDLQEVELAIKAVKSNSKEVPVLATMTFNKTPKGYFTMMGVNVVQAAEGLREAGVDIIGSNCTNGIENMIEIAREFKKHSSLPIIIQPNAGQPELSDGMVTYPETPEYFSQRVEEFINCDVSIIGGCCGTTPDHIRAIKKIVNSYLYLQDKMQFDIVSKSSTFHSINYLCTCSLVYV